jgi:hypothetical protein
MRGRISADGVHFVSLQNAKRNDGTADAPDLDCIDPSRSLGSLSDTTALLENPDWVITVCTSVAQPAAAMGKKTRILLQHRAEWRRGRNRDDAIRHPCVRIFSLG